MSVETSDLLERKLPLIGRYLTSSLTPASTVCRRLLIPDVPEFHAAIGELLSRLCYEDVWSERAGGLTPIEMVMLATQMLETFEDDCPECPEVSEPVLYDSYQHLVFPANNSGFTIYTPAYWTFCKMDLRLRSTVTTTPNLGMRFNQDDTITHYSFHDVQFTNAATYNQGTWNRIPIRAAIAANTAPAGYYSRTIIELIQNQNSQIVQQIMYQVANYQRLVQGQGNWTTTGAGITEITILPEWDVIAAGSEIDIWFGARPI